MELDLLVVNHHKVHPQSCGDTNFVLCIHELQLKVLIECKEVYFRNSCINERKLKGDEKEKSLFSPFCAYVVQ